MLEQGLSHRLTDFRDDPNLEFEGLLKRQHLRVKYFQGSLMSATDLERAQVTEQATSPTRVQCSPLDSSAN